MQIPEKQFGDFLSKTISQIEVSIIIANGKDEAVDFEKKLDMFGFQKAKTIHDIIGIVESPNKVYLNLNNGFDKDTYDFLVQYPTGQIELFDNKQMKLEVASPTHKDVAVVFLVSKDMLRKIESNGYNIRSAVGMAYQN